MTTVQNGDETMIEQQPPKLSSFNGLKNVKNNENYVKYFFIML